MRGLCSMVAAALVGGAASAQTVVADDRSYVYTNSGVTLPAPVQSYGQDEVQAAGGVACRSAVGGGGAYIDMGMVNSADVLQRDVTSAYARVVVPLNRAPKRVDCTRLYELELQRLRMELELARMSLPPAARASGATVLASRPLARTAPEPAAPTVAPPVEPSPKPEPEPAKAAAAAPAEKRTPEVKARAAAAPPAARKVRTAARAGRPKPVRPVRLAQAPAPSWTDGLRGSLPVR